MGNAEGNLFTPRANATAAESEYISNDFTIFNVTVQSNSTAPEPNDHIDTVCPAKMTHFRRLRGGFLNFRHLGVMSPDSMRRVWAEETLSEQTENTRNRRWWNHPVEQRWWGHTDTQISQHAPACSCSGTRWPKKWEETRWEQKRRVHEMRWDEMRQ